MRDHANAGILARTGQKIRPGAKPRRPVEEGDLASDLRAQQRILHRAGAAADHDHGLSRVHRAVAVGGEADAVPQELALARDAEGPATQSRRDEKGAPAQGSVLPLHGFRTDRDAEDRSAHQDRELGPARRLEHEGRVARSVASEREGVIGDRGVDLVELAARAPGLVDEKGLESESLKGQRGRESGHAAAQDQSVDALGPLHEPGFTVSATSQNVLGWMGARP